MVGKIPEVRKYSQFWEKIKKLWGKSIRFYSKVAEPLYLFYYFIQLAQLLLYFKFQKTWVKILRLSTALESFTARYT